ncbi:MAG: type II secretion system GspH family protein [Candidatus Omnitrophica bacterium]|nr:type II secretion system GspH family protein [Candidatus Omnitrophota bacterium]
MKHKGLTLIEIVVSVVLIGIALIALGTALVTGKHFIKRAENDGRALSIALSHKEELLSRSYDHADLCPGLFGSSCTQSNPVGSPVDGFFNWTTVVTNRRACNTGSTRCIPYKEIIAQVNYPEEAISGANSGITKRVTVKDIIPFPKVHLSEANTGVVTCDAAAGCEVLFGIGNETVVGSGGDSLSIDLPAYPVEKDLLVIYNIAINIELNGAGIQNADNIVTRSRIINNDSGAVTWSSMVTVTPIMSQAVINSVSRISIPAAGVNDPHTIEVRWYKQQNRGQISVKRSSLTVLAFERD